MIVSLVHIHNAQEEDIYEYAAAQFAGVPSVARAGEASPVGERKPSAFERALGSAPKGKWRWTVVASALIALSIIGGGVLWGGWPHGRLPFQASDETSFAAVATISALETTPIKAEASGVIDAVFCERGAMVQAEQVCATMEARALRDELARKEPALRAATAEAEKAKAEAAQSKAAVEKAEAHGARGKKMLGGARKAHERAQARLLREESNVMAAEAAINATLKALERTKLVSPVAGTIVMRAVEIGKKVSAGDGSFLVAINLGLVKVEAGVDAGVVRDRRLGDTVSFAVDAFPDRLFQGKIIGMSQVSEDESSADETHLVLSTRNDDGLLRPGTSVNIHLRQSGTRP